MQTIISCEHAGSEIPCEYALAYAGTDLIRKSHRGFDPGSGDLAKAFSKATGAPLIINPYSRLLIDLNRSLDQSDVWSKWSHRLSAELREQAVREIYHPFRNQVRNQVKQRVGPRSPVIHLSVHTFTPVRRGIRREVSVGILFDPDRTLECKFANCWIQSLRKRRPRLSIAANQPYLGTDDGHTTALRKEFPSTDYVGLEIEVSQMIVRKPEWFKRVTLDVVQTFCEVRDSQS